MLIMNIKYIQNISKGDSMNSKEENLYKSNPCPAKCHTARSAVAYTAKNTSVLFLDGDEKGSEDPVPYKTKFNTGVARKSE